MTTETTEKTANLEAKLKFKPLEGVGGGFRQEWITGETDEILCGLDTGSGLGNPMLTFWAERNGKREYYTADMRAVLQSLVAQILD